MSKIVLKRLNRPVQKEVQIKDLLKDINLWLGLLTLIVIIIGITTVFIRIADNLPKSVGLQKIDTNTTVPDQKIASLPTQDQSASSLTDQQVLIKVKNGESFWKISQKVCGSGVYYQKIREENNYTSQKALKQGDILKVSCNS